MEKYKEQREGKRSCLSMFRTIDFLSFNIDTVCVARNFENRRSYRILEIQAQALNQNALLLQLTFLRDTACFHLQGDKYTVQLPIVGHAHVRI